MDYLYPHLKNGMSDIKEVTRATISSSHNIDLPMSVVELMLKARGITIKRAIDNFRTVKLRYLGTLYIKPQTLIYKKKRNELVKSNENKNPFDTDFLNVRECNKKAFEYTVKAIRSKPFTQTKVGHIRKFDPKWFKVLESKSEDNGESICNE